MLVLYSIVHIIFNCNPMNVSKIKNFAKILLNKYKKRF